MKKVNILKYTCLTLISFLTFVGIAKAVTPIAVGDTVYINSGLKNNFRCDGGTASGFSVTPLSDGTGYKVSYVNDIGVGQTNKITCTYDGYIGIGDNVETQPDVYELLTSTSTSNTINVDPNAGSADISDIFQNAIITSVVSSSEYIDLSNCIVGTRTCSVGISEEAKHNAQNGTVIRGTVVVKYKIDGTNLEVTREFSVNISVTREEIAKAYPGGVGVCSFDDKWEYAPWTDPGGTNYYPMRAFEGAVLPNCVVQDSVVPVTFKGWVIAPNSNNSVLNAVGECSGAIAPGTPVAGGGIYTNYYACYEADKFVQLAVAEGNISDLDNWKSYKNMGYIYNNRNHATQAQLPDVAMVGEFNADRKFDGWYNRATGETRQPGDTVELNGDVWEAQYSRTVTERDYRSAVYVNEVSAKKVTGTMKGCSSTSSKVEVDFVGGECQVLGLEPTGDGETADVQIIVERDGKTITLTYQYIVYSKDGQNGEGSFIIDTSENVVYNIEEIESAAHDEIEIVGGFAVNQCSDYIVTKAPTQAHTLSKALGSSMIYHVKPASTCSNTNVMSAFCLDPGLMGPCYGKGCKTVADNIPYKRTIELSKDRKLYKLVHYIYAQGWVGEFGDTDSPNRIASHVALRLVALGDGFDSVDRNKSDISRHYDNYKKAFNAIQSGNIDSAVDGMDMSSSTLASQIKETLKKILKEYDSVAIAEGDDVSNIGVGKSIDSVDAITDGSNRYTINYKGTISFPNTVNNPQLTPCGSNSFNVECKVNSWASNGAASNDSGLIVYNYDVSYIIRDAKTFKAPQTNEEKYELAFGLAYNGQTEVANVYILTPKYGSARLQRLIAFDTNSTSGGLKLYFDIIPKNSDVCENVPAANPLLTCPNGNEPCPNFNEELFKASGCCDLPQFQSLEHIINGVCSSDCAVSTLPQVCRLNTSSPSPDAADLYVIREGSKRMSSDDKDPQVTDQIGTCIVNTSGKYYNANRNTSIVPGFLKTDDVGETINVDSYKSNKYCQVTCKEDWSISMDSFGNYVGVNAVAAGSYFAVLNDIFIGGKRTCYTTYLDYDKYMSDLEKLSDDVVKQYNIYSTNSHQYTNINQQTDSSRVGVTGETKCAVWKDEPTGFDPEDYDSTSGNFVKEETVNTYCETSTDTLNTNKTKCEHAKPAGGCETGYTESGTKCQIDPKYKCPDDTVTAKNYSNEDVDGALPSNPSSSSKCTYTVALECKTEGKAYNYTLDTKSDIVENGKYKKYLTNAANPVTSVFAESLNTSRNISSSNFESYYRKDKIECVVNENKGPGNKGTVTCTYMNVSNNGDGTVGIEGTISSKNLCSSNLSENDAFCVVSDTSYNKAAAFNGLKEKVTSATNSAANQAKQQETGLYNAFYQNVEDFYDCQHFELYNTTDDTNGKTNNTLKSENILGPARNFVKITTAFDPKVSYTYDEPAFMTILGQDNILVENEEKNNSVYQDAGIGVYKEVSDKRTEANIEFVDNEKKLGYYDDKVNLSRNYIEYHYYNPTTLWTKTGTPDAFAKYSDSTEIVNEKGDAATGNESKYVVLCTVGSDYMNYEHGDDDNTDARYTFTGAVSGTTWNAGSCYKVKVTYKKARYISSSIENSSFYKNKGAWFVRGGDVKEHGDTKENAIDNANARGASYVKNEEELNRWSVFGAAKGNYYSYNTFPISLNAPRNLYQYTYWFADIGSYSDGELGRIMGSQNGRKSVISLNNRTCFYEVYEEVCLCCGSEINSYVEGSITITEDFLDENGGSYGYKLSDDGDVSSSRKGILNVSPSSISLTDVNSQYGGSRKVPSNWSTQSPFFYAGSTYLTKKGDIAKKEIEALGENAYAEKAEYSYHLTPATMTSIKEYNSGVGYEVNFSRLKVYGNYTIKSISGSDTWVGTADEMNNKYPTFQHYGSKFLEDYMTELNAVYGDTLTKLTGDDNVCYAKDETELKTKIQSGDCRWIDFVETVDGKTFRLAFK